MGKKKGKKGDKKKSVKGVVEGAAAAVQENKLIKSIEKLFEGGSLEGGSLEEVYSTLESYKDRINEADMFGRNALCVALMQLKINHEADSPIFDLVAALLDAGANKETLMKYVKNGMFNADLLIVVDCIDKMREVKSTLQSQIDAQKEGLEARITELEAQNARQKEELETRARELEHEVARKEGVLRGALEEKRKALKEKKSEATKHATTTAELEKIKATNAELTDQLRVLTESLEAEKNLRIQEEERRKAAEEEARKQEEMKEERNAVAAKAVELRGATEGARDAAMSARDAVMQKNAELMSVNANLNRILQGLRYEIMALQQANQMLQGNLEEESARANDYARMIADSHSGPGGSPNHPRGRGGRGHFGGRR